MFGKMASAETKEYALLPHWIHGNASDKRIAKALRPLASFGLFSLDSNCHYSRRQSKQAALKTIDLASRHVRILLDATRCISVGHGNPEVTLFEYNSVPSVLFFSLAFHRLVPLWMLPQGRNATSQFGQSFSCLGCKRIAAIILSAVRGRAEAGVTSVDIFVGYTVPVWG